MTKFNHEFKVKSVEKALSRRPDETIENVAKNRGVGYSTLQKWIRLAKDNQLEKIEVTMSKERSPQDGNKIQRLNAIMHYHHFSNEQISAYCRENGIYPHHIIQWKAAFLSDNQQTETASKQEQKKLKQENKRLQK